MVAKTTRRAFVKGGATFASMALPIALPSSAGEARSIGKTDRQSRSVLDFGADPTGVSDSTEAFRRACGSREPSLSFPTALIDVFIPAGKYKITATVYVRAGTTLHGVGNATFIDASEFGAVKNSVFKLGWGLIDGVETSDMDSLSGGYPPEICGMLVSGGPSGGGAVVNVQYPGALVHDIWFAAPGLAVYLAGGYLYDCEVDGGLTGIVTGRSTSQVINNVRLFNQNYGIIFDTEDGEITDHIIANVTVEYPKVAGVVIAGSNHRISNVQFTGCKFYSNEQLPSFNGFISISNANSKVIFSNCTFTNARGVAVAIAASASTVIFVGCTWDGDRSNSAYQQSITFKGIAIDAGTLILRGCHFDNLHGYGLEIGGSEAVAVNIVGLTYNKIAPAPNFCFIRNTNSNSEMKVNGLTGDRVTPFMNAQSIVPVHMTSALDWFGAIATSGPDKYVLLPYQKANIYEVKLTTDVDAGDGGIYRRRITLLVEKYDRYSRSRKHLTSHVSVIAKIANAPQNNGFATDFRIVEGGNEIAGNDSGLLILRWPATNRVEDIQIEMM